MVTPIDAPSRAAVPRCGTLSWTSKMPGPSYGLPARHCKIGATQWANPKSVCHNCYAFGGNYFWNNVKASQDRRFDSLTNPDWVDSIVAEITRTGTAWFRWHDSGDLQGLWHLDNIIEVALRCPMAQFWLPTKEAAMLRDSTKVVPSNLTIRLSALLVDASPPKAMALKLGVATSTVVTREQADTCPAPRQGGACQDCRRCWDKSVANVSYLQHIPLMIKNPADAKARLRGKTNTKTHDNTANTSPH